MSKPVKFDPVEAAKIEAPSMPGVKVRKPAERLPAPPGVPALGDAATPAPKPLNGREQEAAERLALIGPQAPAPMPPAKPMPPPPPPRWKPTLAELEGVKSVKVRAERTVTVHTGMTTLRAGKILQLSSYGPIGILRLLDQGVELELHEQLTVTDEEQAPATA